MDRLNKARNKYIHAEYLPEVDGHDRVVGFFYRQIKQMGDTIDIDDHESDAPNPRLDERELLKLIDDMVALGRDICVVSETYFDSLPYKLPEPP